MPISSILTQKRYNSASHQKKLLKWLVVSCFLISFVFLPKISLSATIFTDDFNSYPIGYLNGQGGWFGNNGLRAQADNFLEGTRGITGANFTGIETNKKIGTSLNEGRITFYIYFDNSVSSGKNLDFQLLGEYEGSYYVDVRTTFSTTDNKARYLSREGTWEIFADLIFDEWLPVEIEWQNDHTIRYRLNFGTWTGWVNFPHTWNFPFGAVLVGIYGLEPIYLDYIAENPYYIPPPLCETYENKIDCENSGYCYWWEIFSACLDVEKNEKTYIYPDTPNPDDIIEIYNPVDDLVLAGKIKVGYDDGEIWHYTKFTTYFENFTTGKIFTFEKEITTFPNETINYDENLGQISLFLTDYLAGNYEISYKLFGRKFPRFWETKEIEVEGGVIAVENIIPPPYEDEEFPEFVGESCEGLGTIETWLCEIKNFISSAFYPSKEMSLKLKNTINLIKNKTPFNYLNATKDFFVEIKNGVGTTAVSFKVFGESGILSYAGLDFDVENGEGTEGFISFIRKFFTFIFLIGLMVWCISFIRKLFK